MNKQVIIFVWLKFLLITNDETSICVFYKDYLKSTLWSIIRKTVLERDKHKCVVCHRKATEVHHNSYEIDVLAGADIVPLVSICHWHHHLIEFGDEGKKDLIAARQTLSSYGIKIPELLYKNVPNWSPKEKHYSAEINAREQKEQSEVYKKRVNWKNKQRSKIKLKKQKQLASLQLRERLRSENKISGYCVEKRLQKISIGKSLRKQK